MPHATHPRPSPDPRRGTRRVARALAAVLLLEATLPVHAAILQLPALYGSPPDANVMFTLDDSGSMMADAIPDLPDNDNALPADTNSALFGIRRFPFMWAAGSQYLTTTYYRSDNRVARYLRSSAGNPLYYIPAVTYSPCPTAANDQVLSAPANSASVNIDADDPFNTARRVNIRTRVNESGNAASVDDQTRNFWPATYYVYTGTSTLPLGNPATALNTAANFRKVEIKPSVAAYPRVATRTDCSGAVGATGCLYEEEIRNFANWLQYYRSRMLMAKGGVAAAFARQQSNLRVGFATINSVPVVQRGVRTFTGAARSDFYNRLYARAANGGTGLRFAMDEVGRYFPGTLPGNPWAQDPSSLLSVGTEYSCRRSFHILSTDGYWNGAPALLGAAGNHDAFAGTPPAKPDGTRYTWSDTIAPSAADPLVGRFTVNPFADTRSGTLADVAAYYWRTDLRPTLANNVDPSTRDPAFWQHLTTFTIGLGIYGTGGVTRVSGGTADLSTQASRDALVANRTALNWTNPVADGANTGDDLIHAAMNGRGRYFVATNPNELAIGLSSTLAEAADKAKDLAALAADTSQVQDGSFLYQATYSPFNWYGRLYSFRQDAAGNIDSTPSNAVWEAAHRMPAPAQRNLFTMRNASGVLSGATLAWASLSATQQTQLGGDARIIDWMRGEKSLEVAQGGPFRTRSRNSIGGTDGSERFAYVPASVYEVPRSSPTNAAERKLQLLADPGYTHRFTVDGPPNIADAYVNGRWRSLLVGSTGAGSRGLFTMDVSEPAVSASGFGTGSLMWEFSEAQSTDMGHVLGYAHVVKLKDGRWAVIFGNGVDSATGQASLFVLDAATGALIKQIKPSTQTGNGLSQPNIVLNDNRELETVYAGDLRGNLWKFDFSSTLPGNWGVALGGQPLFRAVIGTVEQPITVMPEITLHPEGGAVVSFGTGRLFDASDTAANATNVNLSTQSLYGIWDKPGAATGLGAGRGLLLAQGADSGAAVVDGYQATTVRTPDWTTQRGWYLDLASRD